MTTMELSVHDTADGVQVSDAVFACDSRPGLVQQVVTAYLAGARQGTHGRKGRSEVRGGGRKPWRQKGSGRARAGSIRSPIWRGGGATFAASTRSYAVKVNRRAYRAAMRSILSSLVREGRLSVVQEFNLPEPKTKLLADFLTGHDWEGALLVLLEENRNLQLAVRNLPRSEACTVARLNPVLLLGHARVVFTLPAVKHLEELLA